MLDSSNRTSTGEEPLSSYNIYNTISTGTMEYLPREVILGILSRLPVTSLLHIKLVCKAWCNMVQDPLLIHMHFSRMAQLDPCLILHSDSPIRNQLDSLELSAFGKDDQRLNKIRVPALPEFNVVGSCKGLLCLCDSSARNTRNILFVYNPFSRDYIELPKSPKKLRESTVFGFGFNQRTNQYKVVKVVYWKALQQGQRLQLYYGGDFTTQVDVKVLTLGDTAWRNHQKLLSHRFLQTPSQVLLSGRIHWSTWPQQNDTGSSIVSFDLEDEQFREVPMPNWESLNRFAFHLVDLGGCLSAAAYDYLGQFEIWIMKEYNVKESWIKEFNIGFHVPRGIEEGDSNSAQPFQDSKWYGKRTMVRVLGLLKTGEVLMEYHCRSLVTYDMKDGTFKDLILPGLPNWFEAVIHEGSLKWIDTLVNNM